MIRTHLVPRSVGVAVTSAFRATLFPQEPPFAQGSVQLLANVIAIPDDAAPSYPANVAALRQVSAAGIHAPADRIVAEFNRISTDFASYPDFIGPAEYRNLAISPMPIRTAADRSPVPAQTPAPRP